MKTKKAVEDTVIVNEEAVDELNMEEKGKVFSMKGKPVQGKPTVYHMRLCLVGSPDMDIKNIQTFGIADDGFFMVKSYNNLRLPTL